MHGLEYALFVLGNKIEKDLDPEMGKRIIELASVAHRYQPPKTGGISIDTPPGEDYLNKYIRVHDPSFKSMT